MSKVFAVGTICIGQNITSYPQYNGMECEIIGPPAMRRGRHVLTKVVSMKLSYKVRWADGFVAVVCPPFLRPKRPPPQTGEDNILALFKGTLPVSTTLAARRIKENT